MSKRFLICSRQDMHSNLILQSVLDAPFAVISVTEPSSNFISYPVADNKYCKGILALKFSDVNEGDIKPGDEERYKLKLITRGQADTIATYAKSIADEVDVFAVNCDAGICRSSAIAAALAEYFNGTSAWIWTSPLYLPNMTVYNMVKESLGMKTLRDYYTKQEQQNG